MSRRRFSLVATAAAVAAVVVLAAPPAWAYWSATTTVAASVSAGTIPVPTTLPCQSMPGLLGLTPYARYSWTAVPGAVSYQVSVHSADGTVTWTPVTGNPTTATHFDLSSGLLSGLDSRLNAFMLENKPVYVSVQAVHSSGWVSAVPAGQAMYRAGLLPGVLGGTKCTP